MEEVESDVGDELQQRSRSQLRHLTRNNVSGLFMLSTTLSLGTKFLRHTACPVASEHGTNSSCIVEDACSTAYWLALWAEGEAQEGFVKEAKENFALLEAQLEGRRFFGGDAIGLVDIAACGFAHWLGVFEEVAEVRLVTEDEFPRFCRWAKEYVSDEKVRACLPDRSHLLARFAANKGMFVAIAKSMLPPK
ncbi:hypothetical protein TRIUR3_21696 [Triticum urartu]|uniref:Uncharacterized protein n=1 Tax=Triticum urartu TaxID=4572 RepID=M7YZ94_TRIUA|nr:hypothetical protein TRIUR3_21696 [Triticum urartu]